MCELLAPAGDMERLKIALLYGADAAYVGGKRFSLRANAQNFSDEELNIACKYAHSLHKKIYVTINIVFHDSDLEGLKDYLKYLKSIEVDAVIVSDIVAVTLANNIGLNVYLSTQASVLNYESARLWKSLGVKRIVLAREAMIQDIKEIKEKCDIEIECFIHGAMCTSISGRCVLSNYCTLRDSNRGNCAQICRWAFNTKDNPDFTFMSKDLNMTSNLKSMIDLQVDSFKIEGRMRSIYYIATVVMCYRDLIDGYLANTLTKKDILYYERILDRVANRDTAPQFYNIFPSEKESYFSDTAEISNQDFLGIVLGFDAYNKRVILEERNHFSVGDVVEFIGPGMSPFTYKIEEIFDENDVKISCARHPKMVVKLPISEALQPYTMMRKKVFDK